jgi:endogenous inhibitor of DNA gyrase (YacG/DUF329 family)
MDARRHAATNTDTVWAARMTPCTSCAPFDNRLVRCPICKKEVPFDGPEMPFCSKRCRTMDLANWADEKYKISTPTHQSEFSIVPDDEEDVESDAR